MDATSREQIGIVVTELGVPLFCHGILDAVRPNNVSLTSFGVRWRKIPTWAHGSWYLPLAHAKYKSSKKSKTYHLITFPAAIKFDFTLDDLDFPFRIGGLVLYIDLNQEFLWREDRLSALADFNYQPYGLGWARLHNLPFVIAAKRTKETLVPEAEMKRLLGIESHIPVITHISNLGEGDQYCFDFPTDWVKQVLSVLAEQIEAQAK
jgi:hypothetical protein